MKLRRKLIVKFVKFTNKILEKVFKCDSCIITIDNKDRLYEKGGKLCRFAYQSSLANDEVNNKILEQFEALYLEIVSGGEEII